MSLRESIQKIISEHAGDSGNAAIEVCLHLENTIGLSGNGWFDDDEIMEGILREHENDGES